MFAHCLWCRQQESDLRPNAYESFALPLSYVGKQEPQLTFRKLPGSYLIFADFASGLSSVKDIQFLR